VIDIVVKARLVRGGSHCLLPPQRLAVEVNKKSTPIDDNQFSCILNEECISLHRVIMKMKELTQTTMLTKYDNLVQYWYLQLFLPNT